MYEGKDARWNEHTFGYDLASETGTLSGSQAMTLDNIFALEDTENKDLNDDGVIGNAIAYLLIIWPMKVELLARDFID